MISGKLVKDRVLLDGMLEGYGQQTERGTVLSLEECAFLLEKGRIEAVKDEENLDFKAFVKKASKISSKFALRYLVYKDLIERGYSVQPGAIDFRLYARGAKPGNEYSDAFVLVVSEREPLSLAELIKNLNAATNIK